MGKDKRQWRKEVKKLRRSRIRQTRAEELKNQVAKTSEDFEDTSEAGLELLQEEQRWHDLEEAAWLERERQSNKLFQARKERAERLAQEETAEKERIRIEWEAQQAAEAHRKAEADRLAKEKQDKQDAEFNQLLEFLAGDIETPPLPYLMPNSTGADDDPCLYFSRTGACRFYERCKKRHPSPALSSTILIENFFTHISLEQCSEHGDANLEYEESELRKEFHSFYEDVLPEFRTSGEVIQFKVCRNFEPHLRGNVYIQYKNIQESVNAYRKFNARFYNGKQLTLRFVKIDYWRTAICGAFNRGVCLKGKACNYLHVFRNSTPEFLAADRDWEAPPTQRWNTPKHARSVQLPDLARSKDSSVCRVSKHRRKEENTSTSRSYERSNVCRRKSRSRTRSISRHRSESRHEEPRRRGRWRSRSNSTHRRHSSHGSKKHSQSKHKKKKKKKSKKHKGE